MSTKKAMKSWPVQKAKACFSKLLEASLTKGPQILTRRGVETAVLVPIEKWRSLELAARPRLKDLLLAESPRGEIPVPQRRGWRW
jgi:prevent-host-death family protein